MNPRRGRDRHGRRRYRVRRHAGSEDDGCGFGAVHRCVSTTPMGSTRCCAPSSTASSGTRTTCGVHETYYLADAGAIAGDGARRGGCRLRGRRRRRSTSQASDGSLAARGRSGREATAGPLPFRRPEQPILRGQVLVRQPVRRARSGAAPPTRPRRGLIVLGQDEAPARRRRCRPVRRCRGARGGGWSPGPAIMGAGVAVHAWRGADRRHSRGGRRPRDRRVRILRRRRLEPGTYTLSVDLGRAPRRGCGWLGERAQGRGCARS